MDEPLGQLVCLGSGWARGLWRVSERRVTPAWPMGCAASSPKQ